MISIVATLRSGDAIEVGTIGREGFMETDAALESDTARRGSFCQVAGDVARMPLARFRERMDANGPFARLMRRSVTATLFNVQQLAACNAKHRVEAQCARWLLMTRDRVGRDAFPLTHESLASLLGVRRASVSVAAQALQAAGAIVHERGMVTIVGPAALRRRGVRVLRRLQRRLARCAARTASPDYRLTVSSRRKRCLIRSDRAR